MRISDILESQHVVDLTGTTRDDVLAELCGVVAHSDAVLDAARMLHAIKERERVMSTGVGMGVAIPHARTSAVSGFVMAVGRHRGGLEFESLDGKPVYLTILIAAPEATRESFLELTAAIGSICTRHGFLESVSNAATPNDLFRLFADQKEIT
jgi:mannitol/fructose-specific phosphotransferase system IIA component (Ntr-type)